MSLEDAIRAGHLVPIRCVRAETNVDLSRVRYNAVNYVRRDLEESVRVPGRDQLVVDTYTENVPGRRAVAFCVNVAHAEDLAKRFREAGIAAVDVSGRMTAATRERILASFAAGDLRVLCACDALNEGWDCPELELLLMVGPTLSRLLYM